MGNVTIQSLLSIALPVGMVFGLLLGIGRLVLRGLWEREGRGLAEQRLKDWYTSPTMVELRKKEVEQALEHWWQSPAQVAVRKREFATALETEVRRDDGMVQREVTVRVSAVSTKMEEKLQELTAEVRALTSRKERDSAVLERIEALLTKGSTP